MNAVRPSIRIILFFLTGFFTLGSVCITISVLSHIYHSNRLVRKNNVIFSDDALSRKPFTFMQELQDSKISDADIYKQDLMVGSIVRQLLAGTTTRRRLKTDTTIGIEFPVRELTSWDRIRVQALKEEIGSNPSLERQKEIQDELNKIYLETTPRSGIDRITSPLKR